MSDEPTDPPQVSGPRPSPRRGAFATPASEIEQATPYTPAEVDDPDPDTPAPTDLDRDPDPDRPASHDAG